LRLLSQLFHRKLSKEQFLVRVFRALAEAGVTDIDFDEASFSFTIRNRNHRVWLQNTFANCVNADEASRRETIRNFVASVAHPHAAPDDYESARRSLMPIIRDPAFNGLLRLQRQLEDAPSSDFSHASQPVAEGLDVGLAYDTEHSLTYVSVFKFKGWTVPFAEALQAAKDNLRDRTDPNGWIQQRPGTFLGGWNDSYDSSRLLLTEFIHRLPLNGDPIVFVPNRGRIWITGSSDDAGLEQALRAGKESHFQEGHPISPNLYRLNDRAWEPFVPGNPALQQLLNSLKRDRSFSDYQQQKEYLDKLYDKNGTDIFVATSMVFKRDDDNSEHSLCVWTRGVDSLLPEAEFIVFMDTATKEKVSVRWDSAVKVIGHLMQQDPDLLPVRYRVKTFPDDGELSELRKVASSQIGR
jgi:hypothetical protein